MDLPQSFTFATYNTRWYSFNFLKRIDKPVRHLF